MNKNVSHNLEGPIKIEDLNKIHNLIEDARLECLSRSGTIDWNYTGGDGSNFSVIFLTAVIETIKNITKEEILTEILKTRQ